MLAFLCISTAYIAVVAYVLVRMASQPDRE